MDIECVGDAVKVWGNGDLVNHGRAAATHLHLAGMLLKRLQDILGHNSLVVTPLYVFRGRNRNQRISQPIRLAHGLD